MILHSTHSYPSADVRLITGTTAFTVHTLILSLHSTFFSTLFSPTSQWSEAQTLIQGPGGTLRQVTLEEISTTDVDNMLAYIYASIREEDFTFSTENVFGLVKAADRFQMEVLGRKCEKYLTGLDVGLVSWGNVEKLLGVGTMPYVVITDDGRKEAVRKCQQFLEKQPSKYWVKVLYLAEQYDLTPLLSDTHTAKYPFLAHHDPFFIQLTIELQDKIRTVKMDEAAFCSRCKRSGYFYEVTSTGGKYVTTKTYGDTDSTTSFAGTWKRGERPGTCVKCGNTMSFWIEMVDGNEGIENVEIDERVLERCL